jgi:hypothetical protein
MVITAYRAAAVLARSVIEATSKAKAILCVQPKPAGLHQVAQDCRES